MQDFAKLFTLREAVMSDRLNLENDTLSCYGMACVNILSLNR